MPYLNRTTFSFKLLYEWALAGPGPGIPHCSHIHMRAASCAFRLWDVAGHHCHTMESAKLNIEGPRLPQRTVKFLQHCHSWTEEGLPARNQTRENFLQQQGEEQQHQKHLQATSEGNIQLIGYLLPCYLVPSGVILSSQYCFTCPSTHLSL